MGTIMGTSTDSMTLEIAGEQFDNGHDLSDAIDQVSESWKGQRFYRGSERGTQTFLKSVGAAHFVHRLARPPCASVFSR